MHPIAQTLAAALMALPLPTLAETYMIDSGGVALHVTDEGEGPAVILLHAFAGSSTLWSAAGLAPLAGLRTITVDARGHGDSGRPTDPAAYGAEMANDVLRVMQARGVERAHIVGYSMGAETALKFAADHPEKVLSLVVAGSGWSGEAEGELYGYISDALGASASFGDFMAAMAPEDSGSEEDAAAGYAMLLGHGIAPEQAAAPLAAVAAAMPDLLGLTAEELAAIPVPVLGLAGDADEEHDNVERLGDALADFTFVTIPGADHLAAPLTPAFAEAVTGFLTR
ncbi:alpha/beta fold hydrolase [Sinisalibacter aestuarii]|uniref:Alpha/beta hydrolase n=1 Tax=Sinisalibacter aestuarii TaxID=2949426 RepID=A0ABQ5LTY2_9RHOB|nr:alpha/beta fold hydrolase [Sinisalibacter aestuarii]GKY88440.1 alpha/beta hydrolase [Sinisalibacter aestuarii]